MRILFSPIGSTDPISNMRDGAMLHICRIYKPDKVYLYLSHEMLKYHRKDNRYCELINKLGELINHKFEIEVIEDEDMIDVQVFDNFVNIFEDIISDIRQKNEVDEIIVNVSSGTPAMKSALQMISMLGKGIVAIQVSTPVGKSNTDHENKDKYEYEVQWECNEDNTDFKDRSKESVARDMLDRIRKENIEKLIRSYDYEAAVMMLDSLSRKPSQEMYNALQMACARVRLDITYVNNNRKKYMLDNWFPYKQPKIMNIYEYLMIMKLKLSQKRYVDFIRDITPAFFTLSEEIMNKNCRLTLADIGWEKASKVAKGEKLWCVDIGKLSALGMIISPRWTNDTFISANVILKILEQRNINETILRNLQKVRAVEEGIRNLAAHEIVGLSEDGIKRRVGYSPDEIMNLCFKMASFAGISLSENDKNIYDYMNDELINLLYN